ncbi:hypothetical protein ACOSQ2_018562 [Xanthoceras sorbifolium]
MKIPRKDMCGYNGNGDPDDHLDVYLDWMNMQGASDALKCKIFPLTLVGDARTWISGTRLQRKLVASKERVRRANRPRTKRSLGLTNSRSRNRKFRKETPR